MATVSEYCATMKARVYDTNAEDFFRVFRFPMKRFWNNLTGFDVVAFDESLGTPDGVSMATMVQDRFGDEGSALIRRILDAEGAVSDSLKEDPQS